MQEIADAANVSRSTVSRVLSGTPTGFPVGERTRQRILQVVRETGYRPNPLARGLRGSPTMLVGLIVRDIIDPLDAAAIKAASIEGNRHGYNIVLGHVLETAEAETQLSHILESRICDAIILLGELAHLTELSEGLQDADLPVVAVWQRTPVPGIPTVNVDNRAGIGSALRHLTDLNHERIAFAGDRGSNEVRRREDVYRAQRDAAGIGVRPGYVLETSGDSGGLLPKLDCLLGGADRPTAIVCGNDIDALVVLQAVQRLGLRVPEDVSITGFDDIPAAALSAPPLTTVREPVREMIETAFELVLGSLRGARHSTEQSHAVLEPSLIVRGSTGPALG
jgi:DNA-binding LacI/PurR family transcriptional regulator